MDLFNLLGSPEVYEQQPRLGEWPTERYTISPSTHELFQEPKQDHSPKRIPLRPSGSGRGILLPDEHKKTISILLRKHQLTQQQIADAYRVSTSLVSHISTNLDWWEKCDVEPAELPEELKWLEGQG
ncbi:hypothetical protein FRB93_003528 [Tulasnella sp. JGI-2019a]|nr:hypothetical protein FRB93_003528 [Tulasnella sp. JGI-2019a]